MDDDEDLHGAAIVLSVFATLLSIVSLLIYVSQNGWR
jgi:hypothetical protein